MKRSKMEKKLLTKIHHQILEGTLYAIETDNMLQIEAFRFNDNTDNTRDNQCLESRLEPYKSVILDYLDGKKVDFSIFPLKLSCFTPFQQRVLTVAKAIPRGVTISYEELAKRAGFPGAARAVGSVMRKNRFPIIIPCHRVISKSGNIGGYSGMQKGAMIELKKKLLNLEGCNIPII